MTIVGVPTEIKTDEYRVALTPAAVRELVERGHEVVVQAGAGEGSAIADDDYASTRARRSCPTPRRCSTRQSWWSRSRSRSRARWLMLRPHHTLFTYLHLAPDPDLTRGLVESGATCVAYETVTDTRGRLPLLAPMSEVAGKIATQAGRVRAGEATTGAGASCWGECRGWPPPKVMVIGGGVVGPSAAMIAIGMQAEVSVFDRSIDRLRELDVAFGGRANTCYASTLGIEEMLAEADMVIGAVLVHGATAPHVVSREQLGADEAQRGAGRRFDRPGRLLRDLTRRRRTPTPRSRWTASPTTAWRTCRARCRSRSTRALDQRDPAVRADAGRRTVCAAAAAADAGLADGVNVAAGQVTSAPVAETVGTECAACRGRRSRPPKPSAPDRKGAESAAGSMARGVNPRRRMNINARRSTLVALLVGAAGLLVALPGAAPEASPLPQRLTPPRSLRGWRLAKLEYREGRFHLSACRPVRAGRPRRAGLRLFRAVPCGS